MIIFILFKSAEVLYVGAFSLWVSLKQEYIISFVLGKIQKAKQSHSTTSKIVKNENFSVFQ